MSKNKNVLNRNFLTFLMTVDETADSVLSVCLFNVLFLLPYPAPMLVLKFNVFSLVIFQAVRPKGVHGH